jgi:hypothetical protein
MKLTICWNCVSRYNGTLYAPFVTPAPNADDLSNKIWIDQSGGAILQGQNMGHCIYIKVKSISVSYLNETLAWSTT